MTLQPLKPWSCYCGKLNRLKFRGVRCIICRTECVVKEPVATDRETEMSDWLACDYRNIGIKNAVRLTLHTRWLVNVVQTVNGRM